MIVAKFVAVAGFVTRHIAGFMIYSSGLSGSDKS